jgi:pyruvate ferredoxin oxidoreductase gamma subunit
MRAMQEMLIAGRGGEGVVLASQILADAVARAGCHVQAFPEFKAERRGAPISAFLRWDETAPIRRRYRVREADVLLSLSPAAPAPELLAAVRPGGLAVLNLDRRFPHRTPFAVARVPASRIAREHGIVSPEGRPMGNVAVLGAAIRLLLPDGLGLLEAAIAARLGARAAAAIAGARGGYARCVRQHARRGDEPLPAGVPAARPEPGLFPVSTTDSLSVRTGAWSLERPVLDEACTACGVCALFCPEGAIDRGGGAMIFDLLHCKGCGICEAVCPVRNALTMAAAA